MPSKVTKLKLLSKEKITTVQTNNVIVSHKSHSFFLFFTSLMTALIAE